MKLPQSTFTGKYLLMNGYKFELWSKETTKGVKYYYSVARMLKPISKAKVEKHLIK